MVSIEGIGEMRLHVIIMMLLLSSCSSFSSYQRAFGPVDTEGRLIGPSTQYSKWSNMYREYKMQLVCKHNVINCPDPVLDPLIIDAYSLEPMAQLELVNKKINSTEYIRDKKDNWKPPMQFVGRAGDCEDYAIAKYFALRRLGWTPDNLRILLVHDHINNESHAVLAVYKGIRLLILDNQTSEIRDIEDVKHYELKFSINETSVWKHRG